MDTAGSGNNRAHTLPLVPMALDFIASLPQIVDRDQVFGERATRGFTNWSTGKAVLDAKAGLSEWRLHDVRRSVATRMADLGIAPHVIEQIFLNHQSGHKGGVHGIYNRSSYEREVRVALGVWGESHFCTGRRPCKKSRRAASKISFV